MIIYGISGLGADKRVFKFLNLNYNFIPIEWIKPNRNESIEEYSLRLSKEINTNEEFILLGVSFGGIVATEISKILNPKLTILISSVETLNELPKRIKWFRYFPVNKILPTSFFKIPIPIACFLFGAKNKVLLKNILDDTDLYFTKWAVNQIIHWGNVIQLESILKINGTKDKLFPFIKDVNTHLIIGGEHFMIVDKSNEISELINQKLEEKFI